MKNNNTLNYDNYEVIFFKMIEGEYDSKEEKRILKEIEKDTFFAFEWNKWKKTQLKPYLDNYRAENKGFFEQLKNDISIASEQPERKKVAPYIWLATGALAAALVTFFLLTPGTSDPEITNLREKHSGQALISPEAKKNLPPASDTIERATAHTNPGLQEDLNTAKKETKKKHSEARQWVDMNRARQKNERVDPGDHSHLKSDSMQGIVKDLGEDNQMELPTQDSAIQKIARSVPKDRFRVTIETEKIRRKKYFTFADLKSQGIEFMDLIEDKKITLVRENSGLYLKLEKDEDEIYYVRVD